jgi:methionyl-tRNA formyltransferase
MGMFKIVLFATADIALPTLEYIHKNHHLVALVTMPDKPRERGGSLTMTAVKKRALELGVAVYDPVSPKEESFVAAMQLLNPDLFVVFAYGHILRKNLLDIPKLGPINLHTSILPYYRGAAPIERAILAGETETGISVMKMDVGMDTGPVYLIKKIAIHPEMDATLLKEKLATLSQEALDEVLKQIASHTARLTEQEHTLATYAPKISKEELDLYTGTKENMLLKVRGLVSYGGVKIALPNQEILKIFKAQTSPLEISKYLEIHNGKLFLKAENGSLELLEVQLPGKKRMQIKEFLNGHATKIN